MKRSAVVSRWEFIVLACIAIFATPAARTATFEHVYAHTNRMGHAVILRRWPWVGQGVTALAFSPNGDLLAAVDSQSSMHLLCMPDLEELSVMPMRLSGGASTLAWTPEGTRLIMGDAAGVSAWGMSARPNVTLLHPGVGGGSVQGTAQEARYLVSPSGEFAAGGRDDKTLAVWNLRTHTARRLSLPAFVCRGVRRCSSGIVRLPYQEPLPAIPLVALAFSSDSRRIAAAFVRFNDASPVPRATICLFDAATGRPVRSWLWRDSAVLTGDMGDAALAFSPDGSLLAGRDDEKIALWDAGTGVKRRTMKSAGRIGGPKCLAFVPGSLLASASGGNEIEIWNTKTGRLAQTFHGARFTQSLAVSRDGRLLASGGRTASGDGVVDLWDLSRLK